MKLVWRWLRLAAIVLHLLLGALLVLLTFGLVSLTTRERMVRWWAGIVLTLFGLRVVLRGNQSLRQQGHMLVLNHVSWIDVYVADRYRATRFVAKAEIRTWPLIGWLCDRTGTIFIERGRRQAVLGVVAKATAALQGGALVGVFPEGTTTDGTRLRPFHANLIQAAVEAKAPLLPATIRYRDRHGAIALGAAFIDDMTMWQSALSLLDHAPIVAELTLLEPIAPTLNRRALAELARQQILRGLGLATTENAPGVSAAALTSAEIPL